MEVHHIRCTIEWTTGAHHISLVILFFDLLLLPLLLHNLHNSLMSCNLPNSHNNLLCHDGPCQVACTTTPTASCYVACTLATASYNNCISLLPRILHTPNCFGDSPPPPKKKAFFYLFSKLYFTFMSPWDWEKILKNNFFDFLTSPLNFH